MRVLSTGLSLDVREHSADGPGKDHVILVHGYPDQQDMWDRVLEALDGDALHLVTYDVRGAGASDAPPGRDGYRTDLLVEDLLAVVAATVPDGERFHLVGHDWGSVQLWDVVAAEGHDARLRGRVASFTSISGPSLDHVAHLSRHHDGRRLRMLNQAVHSWYIYAFHVPVLPEMAWARWGGDRGRNAANGLNLYRANFIRRMRDGAPLRTDVPVQVIVPTRDKFVTDVVLDDLDRACSRLSVVRLDAGHWVTRSQPQRVAELVTGHVRQHA
ncbi:MAG TPA: alpha/beta fold hydrolase [Nocardioidaceae bacterium]|nr:alpha/beta fold hydrolase [Nocardioidaceae bacterium]